VIDERVAAVSALVDEVMEERGRQRIGEDVDVIVEAVVDGVAEGRGAHQGPEDAAVVIPDADAVVGDVRSVHIIDVDGVDLVGRPG